MGRKTELINKHKEEELTPIASMSLTNTGGVVILHYDYGIEDKVFGYIGNDDMKTYFYVRVDYVGRTSFKVGRGTFYIDDFVRCT